LKNQDPEILYRRLCDYHGTRVDRCMLYVFRCASISRQMKTMILMLNVELEKNPQPIRPVELTSQQY